MSAPGGGDHTLRRLLDRIRDGEDAAREELFRLVYAELHGLARQSMRGQNPGHTLQPTALVNEAFLRLSGNLGQCNDRDHLLRVAARAMRQILVDHGRGRATQKRRPPGERLELESLELEDLVAEYRSRAIDLAALDAALEKLEQMDADLAQLVDLHFFGGQSMADCARILCVSERQVLRWWRAARAFLHREVER